MTITIEALKKSDIAAMGKQDLLVLRNRFVQMDQKWWSSEHWPNCTREVALSKYKMVVDIFREREIVFAEKEIDRALFKARAKGLITEQAEVSPAEVAKTGRESTEAGQVEGKERIEAFVEFVGITKGAENPERIVMGVVYEPDVEDAQADWANAEDIRKAAFSFMESGQAYKINHADDAKINVLESYLAPVDFELEGQVVKAGSWVLGSRIKDDEVWGKIEKGEITGYSMAGVGVREITAV